MQKDITGIGEEAHTRKRIKPHLREQLLRNAAQKHGAKLDQVMAIACYRAEEIRAAEEKRDMNMHIAFGGFEGNPFRWASRAWQSQVAVAIFWTWRNSDGTEGKCFDLAMLHNVLARHFPRPAVLAQSDAGLWERLVGIAALETTHRKAPCKYLGVKINKMKYEPDPAKWPVQSYPISQGKTKAEVYFEWEHVFCDGLPHRASIRVNQVLHNGQPVPHNPLTRSTCSKLQLTPEFMDEVGKNVRDGVLFGPDQRGAVVGQGQDGKRA